MGFSLSGGRGRPGRAQMLGFAEGFLSSSVDPSASARAWEYTAHTIRFD